MMDWTALSIQRCIETPPPALDFVIPGLVAGTVGSLVAPGGTGKSWLALQIAAAVAGADTIDIQPGGVGSVLYLAAEDPQPVLHARIHALAARLDPAQREALIERLTVMPTLGKTGDLLDGQTTARIIAAGAGCRLIVLDTLSRWHTGDENARTDAAKVMRPLEGICDATGAATLFLHHTSKAATLNGQGDKQQASRGSSVFVDDARFVMTMTACSESEARDFGIDDDMRGFFVKTTLAKYNYTSPQPARWFRKRGGGVLEPIEMLKMPPRAAKEIHDDEDF